jgi:hypothetical protein
MQDKFPYLVFFSAIFFLSCNPFAPGEDNSTEGTTSTRGDQSTTEGVFQNLTYAYTVRDTSEYGPLIDGNFEFVYTDYDIGRPVTWEREEEMRITYALFQNVQRLDLTWNEINSSYINNDSTKAIIDRTFKLYVTFSPNDRVDIGGNAMLEMQRQRAGDPWMIVRWTDEAY